MAEDVKIDEKITVKLQPPKMWKVVVLNDDHTPMEFVIELLVTVFKHTTDVAKELTMEIHNSGSAIVGIYVHEIAEQRGVEATQIARSNGFPLKITIEEER